MSKEDAYKLGYLYGNDGLTPEAFRALVNYYLRAWSNDIASEFSRGYHDHLNKTLGVTNN